MTGDLIVLLIGMIAIVVIFFTLSKPQKREMTGAEKDAYERRRGEIQAEEEMRRYRR